MQRQNFRYQGIVTDRLNVLPDRKTNIYDTYLEAHQKAEELCKKGRYNERGTILVIYKS